MQWRLRDYDPRTDAHLPEHDFSGLSAVNVCPTFGITRYVLHRTLTEYVGGERHLPTEAGSACHLAFAAERLYRLGWTMGLRDHAEHHGRRIFGRQWPQVYKLVDGEDARNDRVRMCIGGFEASGYYDDPRDKRRTVANIEEALVVYSDRIDPDRRVWVENASDPTCMVGVEIPFRLVIEFTGEVPPARSYAFTGRIDGIEHDPTHGVVPHDNKTTIRMSESWRDAWHLSHQLTGYIAATEYIMSVLPKHPKLTRDANGARRLVIDGLTIPQPATGTDGWFQGPYLRYDYHFDRWAEWFYTTCRVIEKYRGDVLRAPLYTHSCNRYFHTCQFLPFCDAPHDEREAMLAEMPVRRWSPLTEEEPL